MAEKLNIGSCPLGAITPNLILTHRNIDSEKLKKGVSLV
ncbi:hypothetical protein NU08_4395 [Flavobacterium anhuiense]|uniref:Uncharacterized protein n=1 Tax=Flavobacterium anhuiense TaxID=459526 RepID=A0A444VSG2_9FLAO|nr:hypothetical protein NU08_4395 [Flavobacterium anhuiense]